MAGMLYEGGLRAAGLITFKACDVGKGTFLDDFVAALAKKGVILGWAKGYCGSSSTVSWTRSGLLVDVEEEIEDDSDNVLQGNQRFKIAKSPNNPFTTSFGRYA